MSSTNISRLAQDTPFVRVHRLGGFAFGTALDVLLCAFGLAPAYAHHGVAGVGSAAFEGPGAPIESATSTVLPDNVKLLYIKLDHANYETFTSEEDGEAEFAQFWILGAGYGFTSWLSGYAFFPYNLKEDEDNGGFDTRGFTDIAPFLQLGFKYDEGLKLIPPNESADDLEDWHFTIFTGTSIPTGEPNLRDSAGEINPSRALGFGKPTFTLGLTATKLLTPQLTFNLEISGLKFFDYEYDDGNRTQFGDEIRINPSLFYRAYTNPERKLRVDVGAELQYLHLERDRFNGERQEATGGDIYYALPGVRLFYDRVSVAFGIKVPIAEDLNEEELQQGGEGLEDYRVILSASYLF
ncbi:MAG: transporter [Gammaproteobacteria bacterium]